ncbi:alanine racemase [Onishia taeanensis]
MKFNHSFLKSLSERVGGSFYVFDPEIVKENITRLRDRLRSHHPATEVAYALKANYMPPIGKVLAEVEAMGEVVSRFEYDIASHYLPKDRLVFNGPVKRKSDLHLAIESGSLVNIDSFREISHLRSLAGLFSDINIGLRVGMFNGNKKSRFGFGEINGELEKAIHQIKSIDNVSVSGLHCHLSTQDKTAEGHAKRIRDLLHIRETLKPIAKIDTINIGGGLLGDMPQYLASQMELNPPTLEDYADAIGEAIGESVANGVDPSFRLIIEPGVSMVANCMVLVAEVIEVRERDGFRQVLVDTNINNVNPTRSKYVPSTYVVGARESSSEIHPTRLVGNTCMEHDLIIDNKMECMKEGDFIVFENKGAYSINYTPLFITPTPAIVDKDGFILKRCDSAEEIVSHYTSI